jgi:hypothetical protein
MMSKTNKISEFIADNKAEILLIGDCRLIGFSIFYLAEVIRTTFGKDNNE